MDTTEIFTKRPIHLTKIKQSRAGRRGRKKPVAEKIEVFPCSDANNGSSENVSAMLIPGERGLSTMMAVVTSTVPDVSPEIPFCRK